MHLLGRGLAAHLVSRGGVGFQVGPIGGEAVVEDAGHVIAHLLVAGGLFGDDRGQVHRLVQRQPLARRVAVGEVAEDAGSLGAELVEHHAHDGLGIHVLGHGVGLGKQETLQRVLAGAFQKRIVGNVGARVLGSDEEGLGGDAAARGARHQLRQLRAGDVLGHGERVAHLGGTGHDGAHQLLGGAAALEGVGAGDKRRGGLQARDLVGELPRAADEARGHERVADGGGRLPLGDGHLCRLARRQQFHLRANAAAEGKEAHSGDDDDGHNA